MTKVNVLEPEGYNLQIVELVEPYGDLPIGLLGLCTADLQDGDDEIFAVMFDDRYGWITFKEAGIRNKFKIVYDVNDAPPSLVRLASTLETFDPLAGKTLDES
jgi:hypothetical protein